MRTKLAIALAMAGGLLGWKNLYGQRVVAVRPDAFAGTRVGSQIPDQESFLQSMLKLVHEPMELRLAPGVYNLRPSQFLIDNCRNCAANDLPREGFAGLVVSGRGIRLVGNSPETVTLVAHAPLGVLFKDCQDCGISGVTIVINAPGPVAGQPEAAIAASASTVEIGACVVVGTSSRNQVRDSTILDVIPLYSDSLTSTAAGGCQIRAD